MDVTPARFKQEVVSVSKSAEMLTSCCQRSLIDHLFPMNKKNYHFNEVLKLRGTKGRHQH